MVGSADLPLEATTEQLLESAPDGVVIVDESGVIRFVNRQAEALFGYDRDDLVGRLVEVLVPERVQAVHPPHRQGYVHSPTTRPMGAGLELAARRSDGTEFHVDISLSSIQTRVGILVYAAVRDITDRRRIDEERKQLELRVRQAEAEEQRAHLEAQLHQAQRLESIGQLAGGVAHDFNNLLAGIMNYVSLVSTGLDELAAEHRLQEDAGLAVVREDVAEITKVAKRAADLIHQLLIFGRREVAKPEILDLNAIVTEMESLLVRTIGEDVDVRTSLAGDLARTKVDRAQLEQVVMNLVVNARDAMASGGTIVIETTTAVGAEGEEQVVLTVTDTGAGMASEVVARAFEPFFTTKAKGEGSGLGLATVYGIVVGNGGDVTIESEVGVGTAIRVVLPATDAIPEVAAPPPAPAPAVVSAATILLVEDEEIVREPARRMLERHGYTVLAAADADEALKRMDDHPYAIDLLLTDVVMPGRSGRDLANDLSTLSPETRVLFMSGYSRDVIAHQGELDPGVELIEKPFSSEDLLARVQSTLKGDAHG